MEKREAEEFFDLWEPLSSDGGNCPPDQVLTSAAKGACPEEWASHLSSCKQCGSVVEILQKAAQSQRRLGEFIEMARSEAKKIAPTPRLRLLAIFHAFILASPARRTALIAGIVAAMLMLTWPFVNKNVRSPENYSATTTPLEMDKYGKAVQLLQATFEDTSSGPASDPKFIARRRELDGLIRDLDVEALDPYKLAQLNNAIVASNAAWTRSQLSSGSAPAIANTRYSSKLSDFYLVWGLSSHLNKSWVDGRNQDQLSPQERAEAIHSATDQIQVVRIEGDPDQPTFVIQDQTQNWDPAKADVMTRAIGTFAVRSNANVRFQNGPLAQVKFVPHR